MSIRNLNSTLDANIECNLTQKHSPAASLSSCSISVASIDENAVDTSVFDSESDCEDDNENEFNKPPKNYIIKKLGDHILKDSNNIDEKQNDQIERQNFKSAATTKLCDTPLASAITNNNHIVTQTSSSKVLPQLGNIALTNSTDVTFGDKHFYEGPVTIQQFLIQSQEKNAEIHNNPAGHENSAFDHEESIIPSKASEIKNKSTFLNQQDTHRHVFYRNIILLSGILIVVTIALGGFYAAFNNKAQNNNLEYTEFNGSLIIIPRKDWNAKPSKQELTKLQLPVHRVIISHTASDTCLMKTDCAFRIQVIQEFHMLSFEWDDIGYNFLIGGNGLVFEGRGWDYQGAHTKGYNVDSFGISFIGTFINTIPTNQQLAAANLLIAEAVEKNKLAKDYRLYGARQLGGTESPGIALFKIIKTWPHWSNDV